MAKKKYTTRTPIGSTLDTKIHEELKKYSDETKIPMTKILDMAVVQYLYSIKDKKHI